MGRESTGNAYESRGVWYARPSLKVEIEWRKGRTKRPNVALVHLHDEASANARAKMITDCARSLVEADHVGYVAATIEELGRIEANDQPALDSVVRTVRRIVAGKVKPVTTIGGQTYKEVREALTDGLVHAKFPDEVDVLGPDHCKDMVRVGVNYIEPVIGDFPPSAITIDHYRDVLRGLPERFSPARRRFIAWNVHRVLEIAVLLRLIPANPIPSKMMPKLGARRARGFLFPDEEAKFMRGEHEPAEGTTESPGTVPLVRRLLCGVIAREGMRKEEAAGLEWSDKRGDNPLGTVDLERGWVRLDEHKTVDTSGARDWPLDPGVVEALKRWRALQPKGARYVFSVDGKAPPNVEHLADQLRGDLLAVGVKRAELHATTKTRRQINAHDLRGTFVTLSIASGRPEGWIKRRTGHSSSEMIERYRRQAENLAEGGAAQLVPLFDAIPELATGPALATAPEPPPPPPASGGELAAPLDNAPASTDDEAALPVDLGRWVPETRIQVLAPSPA